MKTSIEGVSRKIDWNSGTAQSLGQTGRHDDRASLLHDRQAAGQSLDRLVERRVERIAGRARHHDLHGPGHRRTDDAVDELDRLPGMPAPCRRPPPRSPGAGRRASH